MARMTRMTRMARTVARRFSKPQKIREIPTTITKVRGKIEKISYNQKLHNCNLERTDLLRALKDEVNTSSMLNLF